MLKAIQIAGFTVVAFASSVMAMDYAMSIPEVYKSYSSKECVEVKTYPGFVFGKDKYSCENMPTKFDLVWVK